MALKLAHVNFISVSNYCAQKMYTYWTSLDIKINVVHNYYEIKNFYPVKQDDKIQILSLARVEPPKNPFLWIRVAKSILEINPNINFIWAGDGTLFDECKLLAENHPHISFIGFVNDVDRLYAESDIYFAPNKSETHGISIVGAMAWSIPVVTTPNGGTIESVINDYNGKLVDENDFEGIVKTLNDLIESKKLRKVLGNNGNNRYSKMFTKQIWEGKMNALDI
jgi:glycosyltransferase involved in cell wall biosynthesis